MYSRVFSSTSGAGRLIVSSLIPLSLLLAVTISAAQAQQPRDLTSTDGGGFMKSLGDFVFPWRKYRLPEPPASMIPRDMIVPPSEEPYYPIRADGQPYVLDVDTTVNFTDQLNHFYYDPKWRGEVWCPFDSYDIIERASRLMATWPEYDQFSEYRKLNYINKALEKYSGFGP